MTHRLEQLFGLPLSENQLVETNDIHMTDEETQEVLEQLNDAVDKIEDALPMVKGLDTGDDELDELAAKAVESFESLSDLGYNVDSRFASEIFAVASTMLGHALTAKTTKLNKKLKMVELQLKKAKLDLDKAKKVSNGEMTDLESAEGQLLTRNDLLARILDNRNQP